LPLLQDNKVLLFNWYSNPADLITLRCKFYHFKTTMTRNAFPID
jgi:hypothetical protein